MRQKQKLIQKLGLKLSPVQMQIMKLIETPVTKLEDEIRREVDENPSLEIEFLDNKDEKNENIELDWNEEDERAESDFKDDDTSDFDDFYSDEDDYSGNQTFDVHDYLPTAPYPKNENYERVVVADTSFQEELKRQLHEFTLNERERFIAEYLVGNLEDSGYLERDNQAIANDLLLTYNMQVSVQEIEKIITTIVQQLEPFGIGARNLIECWLIQLRNKEANEIINLAIEIVKNHFDELKKKNFKKLSKKLHISDETLQETLQIIAKLNIRPANSETIWEESASYITPDFIIFNENNRLQLVVNDKFLPKLVVNADDLTLYQQIVNKKNVNLTEGKFIKENVEKAIEYISILNQRENTLYKTMKAIMEYQKKYFLTGNELDLKPMILQDIADKIDMDISTISRVTNSKYVETFFGTIALKELFSESIGDSDTSSKEVKKTIQLIVNEENKEKPYTDEKLEKLLREKGYRVARRTIAKYREDLNIPVARLRKQH